MRNEIVTVFGASGLIGRHTVEALARAGYRVRACVRYPNLAHYLPPMGSVGQIQVMKCNVLDADAVNRAVANSSAVVNLVGVLYSRGHQSFEALHVEAPEAIAKAAKANDIPFVHVSSIGADEDSESRYAASKGKGEARVRAADAGATILRPSLVFGPEDQFFNKFAALARLLPVLPLIGGGHTKFQPVFVGDVADAILKCLEDSATRGQTYELGGPGVYTFKELMQLMLRETGRRNPLIPIPFALATLKSYFLMLLPTPLLTPDQVRLLKHDNVVSANALKLADLGITPDSVEAIVPRYLWRFRPKGQYENSASERAIGAPEIR
jgi:NADH dehydrogenase